MEALMKQFFFCFFLFLAKVANLTSCSCYNYFELKKIEWAIDRYEEAARKYYLDKVYCHTNNLPREKWEYPYHELVTKLNDSLLLRNSERYPVTYHNILIFDQKVGVMAAYRYEDEYMRVFGPGVPYIAGSKKDKEAMVEKAQAVIRKHEQEVRKILNDSTTEIINIYLNLYETCLKKHPSLQTYRDYGLLAHLNNNFELSHEMLNRLMEEAEKTGQLDALDSKFYHELGSVCVEAMAYNEAIDYLSQAIQKDPNNKAAHFDRALAYFETGNFDLALDDYLASDRGQSQNKKDVFQPTSVSTEFTQALLESTLQGASDAAIEFIPSMCSSIYGLGETLWAIHEHPIDSSNQYAAACLEVGNSIVDYCKNINWDTLDEYSEEVKTLYERYDNLSDTEKGKLIGYPIGRYGVEIFAGGALLKGIQAARYLKNVNRRCNLEALAVSKANKEALMGSAFKHAAEREAYFRNIKLIENSQNKHIPGKHNYELQNSIFDHPNPQGLLQKFAGKGKKVGEELAGNPGYKEIVDFKEYIGIWKDDKGIYALPTTRGTIHYRKNGAHIVPAHPKGK